MLTLQIEHPVRDYETWKAAFDADPIGRASSGVRRHRVLRPLDDPAYVMIELDFDDSRAAQSAQRALRELWRGVDVITEPRSRIVETVEAESYPPTAGRP